MSGGLGARPSGTSQAEVRETLRRESITAAKKGAGAQFYLWRGTVRQIFSSSFSPKSLGSEKPLRNPQNNCFSVLLKVWGLRAVKERIPLASCRNLCSMLLQEPVLHRQALFFLSFMCSFYHSYCLITLLPRLPRIKWRFADEGKAFWDSKRHSISACFFCLFVCFLTKRGCG